MAMANTLSPNVAEQFRKHSSFMGRHRSWRGPVDSSYDSILSVIEHSIGRELRQNNAFVVLIEV